MTSTLLMLDVMRERGQKRTPCILIMILAGLIAYSVTVRFHGPAITLTGVLPQV